MLAFIHHCNGILMSGNEASARIKINRLLEAANWCFFPEGDRPANIRLESGVTLMIAIIDNGAGRRCAETLGIPLRETLGLLLLAKHAGHISQARPVVESLRREGMYLLDGTLDRALALVGE
jgi:hypothetical protein